MHQGLFDRMTEEDRRFVISRARRHRYRRSEVILHEGDPGTTIHHIASGLVAIRTTTPMGDTATLTALVRGEAFGEGALFDAGHRRTASVVALAPTETLAFTRNDLIGRTLASAALESYMMEVMAATIRRLSEHLHEALYLPADQRVRRRLAALSAKVSQDGVCAEVPVTQDDLATMAGTTRSTANVVLRDLEQAGVVTRRRGRVIVHDVAGIEGLDRLHR